MYKTILILNLITYEKFQLKNTNIALKILTGRHVTNNIE